MRVLDTTVKKIIAGMIAIIVVGVGYYGYNTYKESIAGKSTYVTGAVERGTIRTQIDATGTINPVNYVDVSTNVAGILKEVLVEENQIVTKGETIALVDPTVLQAMVDNAVATLEKAKLDYERQASLLENGATAVQNYDAAKMAYLKAQSDYNRAQKNLNDAVITAPMSGTIIGTPLKAGQTISTSLASQMIIATIADLSRMEIYLNVDETDISGISVGQDVTFTVDAYTDRTFTGKVSSIAKGAKGNMGITSNSVVYYKVKVEVDSNQVQELLPTMTARASIHGKEVENVLMVPLTAIHSDNGRAYVYVIKDGKPVKQVVETGLVGGANIQILKGLDEGQEIVVSGSVTNQATKSRSPRLY